MSDSEEDFESGAYCPGGGGGPGGEGEGECGEACREGCEGAGMGRRGHHGGRAAAGELSVNKKGTPLYSKEDIREQYCINDKELEVLDKAGRKSILGCFSNQGQVICAFTYSSQYHLEPDV